MRSLVLIFVSFTLNLHAQVIMTEVDGKMNSLSISKMNFKVKTHGFLAETDVTMTFTNPFSRQLIGNFYITLPEKSSITSYALDINNKLVDAVAIEKVKARQVFEAISRRRIDPGLMEWVKGNYFKTRVYPIPAKGSRTIRISILTELQYIDNNFHYEFPLNLSTNLAKLELKVECQKIVEQPINLSPFKDKIEFIQKGNNYFLNTSLLKANPEKISFKIPTNETNWQIMEKADDEKVYFAGAHFQPPTTVIRQKPESLSIIWDASFSRKKALIQKELSFINQLLKYYRDISINVTVIRNTVDETKSFNIKNGESSDLIVFLKNQTLDGGTYLTSKLIKSLASDCDEVIVFTDGMSGLSYERNPRTVESCNTYTINSSTTSDQYFYKRILNDKGAIFNLNQLSIDNALKLYINETNYSTNEASKSSIHLEAITLTQGDTFQTYAGLVSRGTEKFTVTSKNHKQKITNQAPFVTSEIIAGNLSKKFYAHKKLQRLLVQGSKNKILEHGQLFQMVTPHTSLIVLDNVDQYIEHSIEPPESQPKMLEKYLEYKATHQKPKKKSMDQILDNAFRSWLPQTKWYERNFTYPENFIWSKEIITIPDYLSAGLLDILGSEGDDPFGDSADLVGGLGGISDTASSDLSGDDPFGDPEEDPFAAQDKLDKQAQEELTTTVIHVEPWSVESEDMKSLQKSSTPYKTYLAMRDRYQSNPDFYIDSAEVFNRLGKKELAARVISNLTELVLNNITYLRTVAMYYEKLEYFTEAIPLYQKIYEERPDEPQSLRDLAHCFIKTGNTHDAMDLFYSILTNDFPRFDIKNTVITEMNHLALRNKDLEVLIPLRFRQRPEMDLRIVLSWNTDNIDLNLLVTEATGEPSNLNSFTTIGGYRNSFLESYGPETYMLKKAVDGNYKIHIVPAENRSQSVTGSVIARLDVFVNYGRDEEKHYVSFHKISLEKTEVKTQITLNKNKQSTAPKQKPPFYTVSPGDSLLQIAAFLKLYDIDWQSFTKANPKLDWENLTPGLKLRLP